MPCTTVTNFCRGGKVMLVRYQVLLCLNTYDLDAIAIIKLCKLNSRYFTIYLVISQQQGQRF